ncbi:MAG: glycosyltransferase [Solirubrobacterales bacterium]|nr:glycosyltransferase [Solirubrobacterales bacterium]
MRLLYVLERYPELSQTFVAQEILGLQELECEVRVVTLSSGVPGAAPAPSRTVEQAGTVERLAALLSQGMRRPLATLEQMAAEPNWPPPNGSARVRGALRIAPFIADAKWADHIHSHFATEAADIGRLLARATKTPFSFTAHGADAYSDPQRLSLNLRAASFARAASPHVAEMLRKATSDRPVADRVIEIPVAVDIDRFACPRPYQSNGDVISIGRLVEKKGFATLISAFASCQNAEALAGRSLVVIGDGPLRATLEAQAAAEKARVSFLGALPHDQLMEKAWGAALFALTPEIAPDGDRDGRPTVLIEAMAAGLPIISTSIPGIEDLVTPDIGVLAEAGNPTSVALGLESLLQIPSQTRQQMGERGISLVAPYGRRTVARGLLDAFRGDQS